MLCGVVGFHRRPSHDIDTSFSWLKCEELTMCSYMYTCTCKCDTQYACVIDTSWTTMYNYSHLREKALYCLLVPLMCLCSLTLCYRVPQEIKKKIKECKEEKSPILDLSKLDVSFLSVNKCVFLIGGFKLSFSLPPSLPPSLSLSLYSLAYYPQTSKRQVQNMIQYMYMVITIVQAVGT